MDCTQFREIAHDIDRAGTQGFALRAAALDHAEACAECSSLLSELEALDLELSRIAHEAAALQAPARVEAALLKQFRKQRTAELRPRRSFRLAALAIAAGFALVLGLSLRHWIVPRPSRSGSGTSMAGAIIGGAGAAATAAGDANAGSTDEDATNRTEFVSLPYAADPATLEDATIVRVTLSRSALASFGVPVPDLGAAEQIPADIALSEDGSPQAIRLVADSEEQTY